MDTDVAAGAVAVGVVAGSFSVAVAVAVAVTFPVAVTARPSAGVVVVAGVGGWRGGDAAAAGAAWSVAGAGAWRAGVVGGAFVVVVWGCLVAGG